MKLLLTFIAGGAWVTLGTVVSEKFGTKIGGVVAGLPSTAVVTLFFVGWTQSPEIAAQAAVIVPIIAGVTGLFVAIYSILAKKGFYFALSASLFIWVVISAVLVNMDFINLYLSVIGLLILVFISYMILEKRTKIRSEEKRKTNYSASQLIFRALLGGSIMVLGVFLAKIGGPLVGGAFAAFPAMFLGTLIITHFAHGFNFSTAVMKSMVVSGNLNVAVYAVAVGIFYPLYGLMLGTAISYLAAIVSGFFTYLLVKKTMT